MTTEKSCANCRRHRVEKQPKVLGEAFDTLVEFSDEYESVYHCTLTGKRIGLEPIWCDDYEAPPAKATEQLDDLEKRFLARQNFRRDER